MINLLPPDAKKQIQAGRVNVILSRYVIVLCFSVLFLSAFTITVCLLITSIKDNAEATIADNSGRTGTYSSVQAEAATLRSDLATAKSILDNEISYSNAILRIAQTIPDNVVLDNINLNSETFGSPTTLTARARTNQDAVALKNSLQNSPLYFSNVSFQSLSSSGGSEYPVGVTLNLTINRAAAAP